MNAVVYESGTGSAKRYARLLGEREKLPVYALADADAAKGGDVVFVGWIMAGRIRGLKKARKQFNVKAACAVGMGKPEQQDTGALAGMNKLGNTPLFCLRGNCNISALHGFSKWLMKKRMQALSEKQQPTADDSEMLLVFRGEKDCVDEAGLAGVRAWLHTAQ